MAAVAHLPWSSVCGARPAAAGPALLRVPLAGQPSARLQLVVEPERGRRGARQAEQQAGGATLLALCAVQHGQL